VTCTCAAAVPASSGEFLFSSLKVTLGLLLLSFAQCDFAAFLKSRGAARILPLSPGFLDLARDVLIHRGRTLIWRLVVVHCGDIGAPAVLDALRAIAPVHAVRGNNDKGFWASELPTDDIVEVGNRILYVIHDLAELGLEPAAASFAAVLSGHSHRPLVEARKGVLFVNPGSAGPRRFSLPVSVALLVLSPGACNASIIELA
jgi:putative phosphoesterase